MKGMVFTEFLEMVESEFGYELLDRVVSVPGLSSEGAYTSVGNYPHTDMLAMLTELSAATEVPISELVFAFGKYLLVTFSRTNPEFFKEKADALEFLEGIDTVIHTEVLKLYSDVKLPSFDCERPSPNELIMRYQSQRPMADLADGLIHQSAVYFKNDIEVIREAGPTGDAHSAVFRLRMQ
ncbi:MAG: heme NO-binding domain-containing protein [Puniceicoccaceae bacterium]